MAVSGASDRRSLRRRSTVTGSSGVGFLVVFLVDFFLVEPDVLAALVVVLLAAFFFTVFFAVLVVAVLRFATSIGPHTEIHFVTCFD